MTDIIEWPRAWWGVVTCKFQLLPRSQSSQSPWTMRQHVFGPHVQYWSAELTLPAMSSSDLAAREAIVEMLGGISGLLRMGHPFRTQPMFNEDVIADSQAWSDGTFFEDGSGWVNGLLPPTVFVGDEAAYGDTSVFVSGLPALTNRALRRGDLVEFKRNGIADETPSLHRVVRDSSTNSSGQTGIEIVPPLRKGLAIGDEVSLTYPTTVFRLASNDAGAGMRDLSWTGNMQINLVEALL